MASLLDPHLPNAAAATLPVFSEATTAADDVEVDTEASGIKAGVPSSSVVLNGSGVESLVPSSAVISSVASSVDNSAVMGGGGEAVTKGGSTSVISAALSGGGSVLPTSAFSSFATTFGMGLCAAAAATNDASSLNFGKLSPIYCNGATGSRGGTPDIPHQAVLPPINATASSSTKLVSNTGVLNNGLSNNKALNFATLATVNGSGRGSHSFHSSTANGGTSSASTSEKQTYNCHLCGKPFGQPYNLRRHMSTHTGDRPFRCPHCEYAASQNVHLDKHIRRIHLTPASNSGDGSYKSNGTTNGSFLANGRTVCT